MQEATTSSPRPTSTGTPSKRNTKNTPRGNGTTARPRSLTCARHPFLPGAASRWGCRSTAASSPNAGSSRTRWTRLSSRTSPALTGCPFSSCAMAERVRGLACRRTRPASAKNLADWLMKEFLIATIGVVALALGSARGLRGALLRLALRRRLSLPLLPAGGEELKMPAQRKEGSERSAVAPTKKASLAHILPLQQRVRAPIWRYRAHHRLLFGKTARREAGLCRRHRRRRGAGRL